VRLRSIGHDTGATRPCTFPDHRSKARYLGENTLQEIEDLVRVRLLGAARHDRENTALAFGKNIVIVAAGRKVSRCDGHTHAFT
jgi:hypothetical protein